MIYHSEIEDAKFRKTRGLRIFSFGAKVESYGSTEQCCCCW